MKSLPGCGWKGWARLRSWRRRRFFAASGIAEEKNEQEKLDHAEGDFYNIRNFGLTVPRSAFAAPR